MDKYYEYLIKDRSSKLANLAWLDEKKVKMSSSGGPDVTEEFKQGLRGAVAMIEEILTDAKVPFDA